MMETLHFLIFMFLMSGFNLVALRFFVRPLQRRFNPMYPSDKKTFYRNLFVLLTIIDVVTFFVGA